MRAGLVDLPVFLAAFFFTAALGVEVFLLGGLLPVAFRVFTPELFVVLVVRDFLFAFFVAIVAIALFSVAVATVYIAVPSSREDVFWCPGASAHGAVE